MELRNDLRAARQLELADSVRARLTELGSTLEDGPRGHPLAPRPAANG